MIMEKYNKKIDALIDGWRDEIYETLKKWVAIDSPSVEPAGEGKPFGENVRKALDQALSDAEKMGFAVRNFDGYAGDISLGEGAQTLGMLAHLDVVPAGDGWTHDPFACDMADGRVYGRGVMDDKGPAIAALYAMRAVRDAGVELKDGVRLILGCDEEVAMRGMRYYASKVKMPDYGFSPDAEYPLINIEKGGINILLSCECAGEDGVSLPVYSIDAGERVNVVPGTARAVVGTKNVSVDELKARLSGADYKFTVTDLGDNRAQIETIGIQAHASVPELGLNAAGLLFNALVRIGADGGVKDAVAAMDKYFGVEGDGRSAGIAAEDKECGNLTCNIGLVRFDGRHFEATLDIRYPLATSEEKILGQMCYKLTDTPLSVRRLSGRTVHYVSANHKVVKGLLEVYHDVTGLPAYPIAIGGGTYSRMMPNTVAFGINFPGDTDTCHMPDEYIDWEKFILSVKIFAHAIETLAKA